MESRQLQNVRPRDDTQAPLLLGLGGTFLLISILLLSARFWSRMRNLKADDWTVLAATFLAIMAYLFQCLACFYGLGRRTAFVPASNRRTALRFLWIVQVLFYWGITFAKLSVALLLLRLRPSRRWKIFLCTTMALLIIAVITQTLFQFLQCRPFSVYWDPRVVFRPDGLTCFSPALINGQVIANSSIHVATDLILSCMPISFIRKLNRPRSEKIFLSILMGLGLFASTFAILRTVGLKTFINDDFFRNNTIPTLWAMLELEVALIAATIPTLRNFLHRALVKAGAFFYDEESESQIRGRLVELGFLASNESDAYDSVDGFKLGRKPSKPDIEVDAVFMGKKKKRDEFGDTIEEREAGVESMDKDLSV